MKNFKILKTFRGSQTGAEVDTFEEGSERLLSDDLAKTALNEKWVEPAEKEDSVSDDKLMPSTVKDLKAALTELEVDIPEKAKKTDLAALWTAAQSE